MRAIDRDLFTGASGKKTLGEPGHTRDIKGGQGLPDVTPRVQSRECNHFLSTSHELPQEARVASRMRHAALLVLSAAMTSALVLPQGLRPVAMAVHPPVRAAATFMQEGGDGGDGGRGRETEKSRGRTAVIERPKPKPKSMRKEDVSLDANWKVLLHNDDVHTFEYCTGAICSVVRTIKRKKAHTITVQAHSMGTAVVTQTYKQKAKEFCLGLQKYGLTSSISPE